MSKHVISMSLYGRSPRYLDAAIPLVEDIHRFFPGYVPRFYVSQEVEEGFLLRLVEMGCEIVRKERKDDIDGMFWWRQTRKLRWCLYEMWTLVLRSGISRPMMHGLLVTRIFILYAIITSIQQRYRGDFGLVGTKKYHTSPSS